MYPRRAGIGRISSSSAYIATEKSTSVNLQPLSPMFQREVDEMDRSTLRDDADHAGRR